MKPLWKLRSGEFAGVVQNKILYDSSGKNIGWLNNDNKFYSLSGQYVGEIYKDDKIGKRANTAHARQATKVQMPPIPVINHQNKPGIFIAGWEDSDL